MTEDIKDDIDNHDKAKMISQQIQTKQRALTPQGNHTSEELEDKYLFL